MASVLALIAFLALFIAGHVLVDRLRGRSHCGGCNHAIPERPRPTGAGDCCGDESARERT